MQQFLLSSDEQARFDKALAQTAATKVTTKLISAGYDAYLVGGCVRDILLHKQPKDFDVATNATPQQIKAIFKQARLIGKRFQIIHVQFGREIIEVTTFRGGDKHEIKQKKNKQGMLIRDNAFGSIEEDANRRDFTVNAFYYRPKTKEILDFCNGLADLKAKKIRLIGPIERRLTEDPVRILRAIRFAVKLTFTIQDDLAQALPRYASLLADVSTARLFDETTKLFLSGNGLDIFLLLAHYQILPCLIYNIEAIEASPIALNLTKQALINSDQRIHSNKSVTPAFLFAAFLWPSVLNEKTRLESEGLPPFNALYLAAANVMAKQSKLTQIPKRFQLFMRDIWELQFRLIHTKGKKSYQAFNHPRFRAGYDFLLIREQVKECPPGIGEFWTSYQQKNPHSPLPASKSKKKYTSRNKLDKKRSNF